MGGFPSSRGEWAYAKVDISSNGFEISHFIARLGWHRFNAGSFCPSVASGKLEVYGLRVYLLESLVEIRGSNVKFDFEAKQSFSLRVQAQDSSGLQSIGEIVVFVIDVNEPPKFEDHMFLVPEIRNSDFDIIGSIVCEDPDTHERHTWGIDSVIFSCRNSLVRLNM